jgi:hypothetical protein
MSVKARIEKDQARRVADHADAAKITPPALPAIKPEDDVDLQAALAKVASGELVAAFRTRNGSLVTTRAPGGKLHDLQKSADAPFDFDCYARKS